MKPHTYENTSLTQWWKLALKEFADRGLREPLYGETKDAYEMGETPDTWAEFVRYDEDYQKA